MDRERKHPRQIPRLNLNPDLTLSHIPQSVLDRSAALALTKLSNKSSYNQSPQKRYLSEASCNNGLSEESRGVIYNHKHLQYVPPPKRSPASSLSSGMTNGRLHAAQLYPPTAVTGGSISAGRPVQQELRSPMTKSVGVGANLNYARGGQAGGPIRATISVQHSPNHMNNSNRSPNPNLPEHLQGPVTRPEITITAAPNVYASLGPGPAGLGSRSHHNMGQGPGPGMTMPGSLSAAQTDLLFSHYKGNANKIVSQNVNGTLSVTGVPTNDSELQLFRVLQRANLLNYFDVMIELGGDDVQQLCDAGEEEFLEIMALIGMASKPLHVRRLQKSLQEWMTQPNLFPSPILGPPLSAFTSGLQPNNNTRDPATSSPNPIHPAPGNPAHNSAPNNAQLPIRPIPCHSGPNNSLNPINTGPNPGFLSPSELKSLQAKFHNGPSSSGSESSNSPKHNAANQQPSFQQHQSQHLQQPQQSHGTYLTASSPSLISNGQSPGPNAAGSGPPYPPASGASSPCPSSSSSTSSSSHQFTLPNGISLRIPSDQLIPSHFLETRLRTRSEPSSPAESPQPPPSQALDSRSSVSPIPFLQDHEVEKITESAKRVLQSLPDYMGEPKVTAKRKSSADFETVIRLSENDPNTMAEIRKYAAIYGRYDCKRKVQKPLTIHELSLNEAASQLCKRVPALLTRREELLLLSRQAVRDAGLPYSSIITIPTTTNMFLSQHHGTVNGRIGLGAQSENNGPQSHTNYSNGQGMRVGDGMEIQEYNRPKSESDVNSNGNGRPSAASTPVNSQSRSNSPNDLMVASSRKRSSSSNSPGLLSKDRKMEEPENVEPDDLSVNNSNSRRHSRASESYANLNNNNNNNNASKTLSNLRSEAMS